MAIQAKQRLFTPEEYLLLERQAECKSEYVAGQVYSMAGASPEHNLITVNVASELRYQLKGKGCQTYANDMRVKVSATGVYTYPDVVVVCGGSRFEDDRKDTLINPTVIVEVLSPSTEAYDRGDKFGHYRTLESLRDYVLIAQDRSRIEHFARQPDGQWLYSAADHLEESVHLASIGCTLRLSEVYDQVAFALAADERNR